MQLFDVCIHRTGEREREKYSLMEDYKEMETSLNSANVI